MKIFSHSVNGILKCWTFHFSYESFMCSTGGECRFLTLPGCGTKASPSNITSVERKAIISLRRDQDIAILPADRVRYAMDYQPLFRGTEMQTPD